MNPAPLIEQAAANIARVKGLIDLFDQLVATKPGRPNTSKSDVLRAAVVLLHATLDEFLRSLASLRLPQAGPDALRDMPFPGESKKMTEFNLGELSQYRGKTVDDVIADSIRKFLREENYNNVKDISTLFERVGLSNKDLLKPFGSDLTALMTRRHHIAHRFDVNEMKGRGHHRSRPIRRETVGGWVDVVERFLAGVSGTL